MMCYCKILHILYKDHVTNEEVRAKIQQAIGPHEDLLTIIKRRKLQWYGHVSCSSGLAKTILQGTVKGGKRWGGQRKRWEDNIREWTGLEFGKSQRAVENREKWRKLVAKSSVVPQRPLRLRNWWWWWHTGKNWEINNETQTKRAKHSRQVSAVCTQADKWKSTNDHYSTMYETNTRDYTCSNTLTMLLLAVKLVSRVC